MLILRIRISTQSVHQHDHVTREMDLIHHTIKDVHFDHVQVLHLDTSLSDERYERFDSRHVGGAVVGQYFVVE